MTVSIIRDGVNEPTIYDKVTKLEGWKDISGDRHANSLKHRLQLDDQIAKLSKVIVDLQRSLVEDQQHLNKALLTRLSEVDYRLYQLERPWYRRLLDALRAQLDWLRS